MPTSMSLAVIARAAGATEADDQAAQPAAAQRGRTPPGETGYVVRVPRGAKADFQRKLAELQTDWDGYDAYVVAHGERFEDVATTFGISLGQLQQAQRHRAREPRSKAARVLVVPRISEDARAKNRAKAKAKLLALRASIRRKASR